ncbi:hypothetical protein Lfu02_44140 [Longispora fulva]|uniref:Membrane-associated phospholipid phosphatase n=1 Tax=Longispora fulva TaxID=619741 RepID=A0A8J7GFK7_9ACTN|nr:DUF3040 domain-containing protein [Longispora fulva]MBG6136871.1 membrane-associated phospholipid phosphatase [Longispora fulva]GIG60042.1 hypothetical protein Lfu02_44140 [Longispora fulva]
MLNQDDRRRLEAIERRLEAEDPRFVARMRRPRPRAWIWILVGYVVASVAIPTLGLRGHWPSVMPALLLGLLLALAAWWASRRRKAVERR